jgi:hypothetical protein
MRTTVTLDPDTEHIVRLRMKERGVSFKRALNDAIRDGVADRPAARHETPTFDMGAPTVDITKAMRLAGELEDEALIARIRRGA